MKKIILSLIISVVIYLNLSAGVFWTLGENFTLIAPNDTHLNENLKFKMFFAGNVGFSFKPGIEILVHYENINVEDVSYLGENARAVANMVYLGVGYSIKINDGFMRIGFYALPGIAPAFKYRLDTTSYYDTTFVFEGYMNMLFNIFGRIHLGFRIGGRYLKAKFDDTVVGRNVNFSGPFVGLELRHQF